MGLSPARLNSSFSLEFFLARPVASVSRSVLGRGRAFVYATRPDPNPCGVQATRNEERFRRQMVMRPPRASMIATLSLLAWAATAGAECA